MSSLTARDRIPLCLFSFTDGRRCRTPRISSHPHFCFYHAQKEAQSQAAETLGKDLSYFFSGDYLSACDLSTALSRLIPAVVRGELKPKLARTVAYLMQTLLQTIHVSQDEYINAFSTDGWRKAVRNSVKSNHEHLFPPAPSTSVRAGSVGAGLAQPEPPTAHPPAPTQPTQSPAPASAPTAPSATSSSVGAATSVAAGLALPEPPNPTPSNRQPSPSPTNVEAALSVASSLFPPRPNSPTTQPAASQPNNGTPPAPPQPQPRPSATHRDPYAVHFDHNYTLRVDGKPF